MSPSDASPTTYHSLLQSLLPPLKPAPLIPSPSPSAANPSLTPLIANLRLHPTLEALLHLLNADLPSAHFIVRHMQSPDPPGPGLRGETTNDDTTRALGPERSYASIVKHSSKSNPSTQTSVTHLTQATSQSKPSRSAASSFASSDPLSASPSHEHEHENDPHAEGMLLHALLHRLELDTPNALAWYTDVSHIAPRLFATAWSEGVDSVRRFLARVQRVRGAARQLAGVERKFGPSGGNADGNGSGNGDGSGDSGTGAESRDSQVGSELERFGMTEELRGEALERELRDLRGESEREIRAVVRWCEERFGTGRWEDVRDEWRGHGEKVGEMAKKMVVGGEGWREF